MNFPALLRQFLDDLETQQPQCPQRLSIARYGEHYAYGVIFAADCIVVRTQAAIEIYESMERLRGRYGDAVRYLDE